MARGEVTGRKPGLTGDSSEKDQPAPRLALTIREFCEAFRISEDFFYKLKRQGQTPDLMKVGARTLISMEAANKWRVAREAAAEATTTATAR